VAINVTGTRRLIHHNIDSIIFDHEKAGYDLTSYLIQLGHKQIVLVSYPGKGGSLEERTQGYLQAMRDSGLTPSVVEVPSYSSTRLLVQDTYRFIKNIWGSLEQVSACIGINDDSALGILFALKELGVSVPDKVSVAGFDDSNAVLGVPQLTTMRLPLQQEGETAGRLLSERIATIEKIATCTTLECEMVVRESTGPFQG
jgi:DNA-binding LacI/PurR family transcriptional regulator